MKNDRVKEILSEYVFNKTKLKNTELELERVQSEFKGISGMSYESEGGGGTNAINRKVESEAMQRINNIERLKNIKRELEIRIEQVDNALNALTDIERKIIEYVYFDNWDLYAASEEIGLSYGHCSRLHNKALKTLNDLLV